MTFTLRGGREISRCGMCPKNQIVKNPLKIFPASHHCNAKIDPMFKEGRLILNPNIIPGWCPFDGS